jgi:hypothetical protein
VISAFAVMGGVQILAPEDVRLQVTGIGVMGGFGENPLDRGPVSEHAPVVRVRGLAFWGGVNIRAASMKRNEEGIVGQERRRRARGLIPSQRGSRRLYQRVGSASAAGARSGRSRRAGVSASTWCN